MGIKGTALKSFQSCLSGRSFFVHLGDSSSGVAVLVGGVPQGSVLGPTLFPHICCPWGLFVRNIAYHILSLLCR